MNQSTGNNYTDEERTALLKLARTTIEEYVTNGNRMEPDNSHPILGDKKFREKRGVFVTLHKNSRLRGCIGYPIPIKPLLEAVIDNAVSAAVEDPRFPPVQPQEIPDLHLEISILTVPQKVTGPEEVEVGRDGIIISKGFMRGLLLPQVPVEQGWDRDEYISYGCQKAGLPPDEWRRGVTIETFQAEVFRETED